jgi:hypothetical protein
MLQTGRTVAGLMRIKIAVFKVVMRALHQLIST